MLEKLKQYFLKRCKKKLPIDLLAYIEEKDDWVKYQDIINHFTKKKWFGDVDRDLIVTTLKSMCQPPNDWTDLLNRANTIQENHKCKITSSGQTYLTQKKKIIQRFFIGKILGFVALSLTVIYGNILEENWRNWWVSIKEAITNLLSF